MMQNDDFMMKTDDQRIVIEIMIAMVIWMVFEMMTFYATWSILLMQLVISDAYLVPQILRPEIYFLGKLLDLENILRFNQQN